MYEKSGRLAGLRILVVEDQFLIAMSHEEMLHALGCKIVGPVATVEQALAATRKERLDGALLDSNLDGKSILPAAETLARRGIPFILVTGYESSSLEPRVIAAAPRLTKPFELEALAEMMAETFAPRTAPAGKRRRRSGSSP